MLSVADKPVPSGGNATYGRGESSAAGATIAQNRIAEKPVQCYSRVDYT